MLDGLVTEAEVHKLLDIAKKGLSKGGGSGGASILGKKGYPKAAALGVLQSSVRKVVQRRRR